MTTKDEIQETARREQIQEEVDPEGLYCRGCGKLLDPDTDEQMLCAECE